MSASKNGLAVELRPLAIEGEPPLPPRTPLLRRCPDCGAVYGLSDAHCTVDARPLVPISDEPIPGGSIGVYCLGARLGSGGMGVVLAGEHAFLHRAVAIKLLHRSIEQEPVVCRRFLAEARAAARIRHPGVVEVLDYGLLHDGRPYLVMERIAGESLEDSTPARRPPRARRRARARPRDCDRPRRRPRARRSFTSISSPPT